jgi:hypothetical protein
MSTTSDRPRAWNWETDGAIEGGYVATREITTRDGRDVALIELKLAETRELIGVWLSPHVLRNAFAEELRKRIRQGKTDFEPGERITIKRGAAKVTSASGNDYWPFEVEFEFAASSSAKEILLGKGAESEQPASDFAGDDIPF